MGGGLSLSRDFRAWLVPSTPPTYSGSCGEMRSWAVLNHWTPAERVRHGPTPAAVVQCGPPARTDVRLSAQTLSLRRLRRSSLECAFGNLPTVRRHTQCDAPRLPDARCAGAFQFWFSFSVHCCMWVGQTRPDMYGEQGHCLRPPHHPGAQ